MIKLTQFKIKTKEGIPVLGEYEGNEKSGKVIVFSHGFGLQRDNRGKYTELGNRIKDRCIVIRFDYNKIIDDKSLLVPSLDVQVDKLGKVLEFVKEKFSSSRVNAVGHSMGCSVVGSLSPNKINKAILSAPVVKASGVDFIKNFSHRFEKDGGTNGYIKMKRSDGSYTYLENDFISSLENNKPIEDYLELGKKSILTIILPTKDKQIEYNSILKEKSFNIIKIKADHDFSGRTRKKWIKLIVDLLK
jgi:hypothetical protein